MPKERRRRHGPRGDQPGGEQHESDEVAPSTISDGREGAAIIEGCEVEEESQREEGLTTLSTLLAGPDRAALVNQPRLGPVLLERINDGSLGVRVAALGTLRNLLLGDNVPALGGDPTPIVLKNLAVGLRAFLNIADEPMPKLPTLTVPITAASAVFPTEGTEEIEPVARGEPGFDKIFIARATRVALAAHSAEVLSALTMHSDAAIPHLLSHEACPFLLRAIHASASLPAPGEAELEGALARLTLLLSDAPSDLAQVGPMLSEALLPCLAQPASRYAPETRAAFAASAALLLADLATAPPLGAAVPFILIALSDAMQPDAIAMRTQLIPALAASPAAALLRGTEEAEAHLRQVLRAQRLALEAVANLLVTEDTEAGPDVNAEVQESYVAPTHAPAAAASTQHTQVYQAMQAQLVSSPLLLPLIARKCLLPDPPPANVIEDLKETDEAFVALLEAALDALLNYLLSEVVPTPAAPVVNELWSHLCQLGGQMVARRLSAQLPATAQCLAALARRPKVAIAPTEGQLDGLAVLAGSGVETIVPSAVELLALLRRSLGARMSGFTNGLIAFIEGGNSTPPACLSAALNAAYDTFADDFPAPPELIASLQRAYPVIVNRLREQRRTMDPNEWEHLDEARLNLRGFLTYKGVR